LNTTISRFIWKGEIFRVPLSTLQRPKEAGGWRLINKVAKWLALFIFGMEGQGMRKGTFTAELIKNWRLHEKKNNLP